MEGTIILSRKETRRIRVMEQVVFGSMSLEKGCHLLGISYRHGKRIRVTSLTGPPDWLTRGVESLPQRL